MLVKKILLVIRSIGLKKLFFFLLKEIIYFVIFWGGGSFGFLKDKMKV